MLVLLQVLTTMVYSVPHGYDYLGYYKIGLLIKKITVESCIMADLFYKVHKTCLKFTLSFLVYPDNKNYCNVSKYNSSPILQFSLHKLTLKWYK